ncbi:hypothetical protein N9J72_03300 [Candidatus Gracilibacteria bacterium]|nr:hypothetical protein [Candidatus Gracilibacteria bacterium]
MLTPFPFSELDIWYTKQGRKNLPWRDYNFDTKTLGYRVWLAETMLQQTQVERVKSYFENILEAFPTVEDLANCSYEDFFPYYKGLGYYSRARNMLKSTQVVVDTFDGIFPKETDQLKILPGVGPYTAEAVRAFAYNIPTLSFDTNLEKIFSRYYFGNKFQKISKKHKAQILQDFQKSGISGRDINNALMDYGATASLNSVANIDWEKYPLKSSKFFQTRGELEPAKQKKISTFPNKHAYIFAILHENHKVYFESIPPDTSLNSLPKGEMKPQTVARSFPSQGKVGKRCLVRKEAANFSPFFIGKNTGNPRALTQEYFLHNFGLEVSVRPPEVKSYNSLEVPYMVCYCQIQSGTHNFKEFENLKVRGFEEGFVEQIEFGEELSLF